MGRCVKKREKQFQKGQGIFLNLQDAGCLVEMLQHWESTAIIRHDMKIILARSITYTYSGKKLS